MMANRPITIVQQQGLVKTNISVNKDKPMNFAGQYYNEQLADPVHLVERHQRAGPGQRPDLPGKYSGLQRPVLGKLPEALSGFPRKK